jgi:hypothetical protein
LNNANALIRAEFRQGTWTIVNPGSNPIVVDQLLMDVESSGDGFAVGTVLAVHGLPEDIAAHLPPRMLRALGVGFPIRIANTPRGCSRVRCVAGKSRPVRA